MKLIDYLSGERRGREAHDLELEAQRDPLLAEALQGLEETPGDHHAAVESLRRRIAARADAGKRRRRMRLIWRTTAVAAALLIAVTAGFLTLQRAGAPEGREIARGPEIPEFPTVPALPSGEMAELPIEVPERPERPPIPQPSAVPSKVPPQDGIADPVEQPRGDEDTDPTHPVEGEEEQPVIRAYGAGQKAEYTGSTTAQQKAETPSVAAHPSVTAQERPATERSATERPATERPATERPATEGDFAEFNEHGAPVQTVPVPEEEVVKEDTPFLCAETLPRFQGKDLHAFRTWVQKRVRHPKLALINGVPGRVVVSFVLDTTGRLTQIQVLQTPDRSLTEEVVRVLKRSPRWEPGRRNGRKVPIKYTMPVDFRQQTSTTGEK